MSLNYRDNLYRRTGDNGKICLFIMLNPSTADDLEDDPTIRKCIHYSKREGCGLLTVVNLFNVRSTNPDNLLKMSNKQRETDCNILNVEQEIKKADLIILAWGSHPATKISKREQIVELVYNNGKIPYCLKINKDGNPAHPLYQRNDQELLIYPTDKDS